MQTSSPQPRRPQGRPGALGRGHGSPDPGREAPPQGPALIHNYRCIYTNIDTHKHIYIYIYTYNYISISTYVCMYVYIYIYHGICMFVYVQTYRIMSGPHEGICRIT